MTACRRIMCHVSGETTAACAPVIVLIWLGAACRDAAPTAGNPDGPPVRTVTTGTTSQPAAANAALPRTSRRAAERRDMVKRQIADRGVRDPRVLAAMRNVPRHWFVPGRTAKYAYEDRPLPIGYNQTISQPYIVALMTELLELEPGEKVLEIGTGSGYQAAVLAELTSEVYTIEIVKPLAERTIKLLKDKGYHTIHTRIGDGYKGWTEHAPFDAIIVTCAPESPPPPLVEQLAVGGRMCIPVGSQWLGQELILLRKQQDGSVKRAFVLSVRFVPMTGKAQKKD